MINVPTKFEVHPLRRYERQCKT